MIVLVVYFVSINETVNKIKILNYFLNKIVNTIHYFRDRYNCLTPLAIYLPSAQGSLQTRYFGRWKFRRK
jgi:hypothetical protein